MSPFEGFDEVTLIGKAKFIGQSHSSCSFTEPDFGLSCHMIGKICGRRGSIVAFLQRLQALLEKAPLCLVF